MLGGRPVQNLAADLHADAKSWTIDRLDFRAPGATRVVAERQPARSRAAGSFNGALSVEFVRSGCAGGVAAGPQRDHLSQPEAAAPARRCQRGRRPRRDRRHEGRDRRRRRRRADRALAIGRRRRLALRCRAEGRTSRSRCRDRLRAFAGRARKPNGRTRLSCRWISTAPSRPARNCIRSRRSSATARRRSRSIN